MNNKSQYFANDQPIPELDPDTQDKVRSQAYLRQPSINHPSIVIAHEPINAKQCLEIQRQLKGQVVSKIDEIKNNETQLLAHEHILNYDQHYSESMGKDMYNEGRLKNAYEDIREMHNMADMLLDATNIWDSGQLYLYQRNKSYDMNRDRDFQEVFKKYRQAYQAEQKVGDGMAEDAIQRAKRFLLKDYE